MRQCDCGDCDICGAYFEDTFDDGESYDPYEMTLADLCRECKLFHDECECDPEEKRAKEEEREERNRKAREERERLDKELEEEEERKRNDEKHYDARKRRDDDGEIHYA